jgi:hypothetical protein
MKSLHFLIPFPFYFLIDFDFKFWGLTILLVFRQYFIDIMATSFSGGKSRSTRREPPTMGKQLMNFITCGCESSAPFFVIYKAGHEPTPYW